MNNQPTQHTTNTKRQPNLAGKVMGVCAIVAGKCLHADYALLRTIVQGHLQRADFAALIHEHDVFALCSMARTESNCTLTGIVSLYSLDAECGQKLLV